MDASGRVFANRDFFGGAEDVTTVLAFDVLVVFFK
jgi:hypothetical protein